MLAVLVAAGQQPTKEFAMRFFEQADLKIAVDGGLFLFEECRILPDLLLGDMDSVDSSLLKRYADQEIPLYCVPPEKNETDGMLALDTAIKRGADRIVFLGATGGRIDHLLSNLMLLKRAYRQNVRLLICDERQEITLEKDDFKIMGTAGQTVSLIPMDESVCVTAYEGLYYPLDSLVLTNDQPRGVSNVLTGSCARLKSEGYVLVIKNME